MQLWQWQPWENLTCLKGNYSYSVTLLSNDQNMAITINFYNLVLLTAPSPNVYTKFYNFILVINNNNDHHHYPFICFCRYRLFCLCSRLFFRCLEPFFMSGETPTYPYNPHPIPWFWSGIITQSESTQWVIESKTEAGCRKQYCLKRQIPNIRNKNRIYKTTLRPIMAYTAETRADTCKT